MRHNLKQADLPFLNAARPATAALTDPSTIANLTHWWKADSFNLSDGTAIGGTGNEWVDPIGGSTYYGRQATSTVRPTFQTNITNGKPGILFKQGNSFSPQALIDNSNGSSSNKITLPSEWTVFCVVKAQAVSLGTIGGGVVLGDAYNRGGLFIGDVYLSADDGTTVRQSDNQFWSFQTNISNATWRQISGSIEFYRNNLKITTTGSMTLSTMKFSHTAAAANYGGNSAASSTRYGGYVFEMLVYGRALTTTEMTSINTYFNNRWALTGG